MTLGAHARAQTITLRSPLLHYSWRDYQHVLEKHLKYILSAGTRPSRQRASIPWAFCRSIVDFVHQYVRLGWTVSY